MKKSVVFIVVLILLLVVFDLIVFSNLNKPTQSENALSPTMQQEESSDVQLVKSCQRDDTSCGIMTVEVNLIGFGKR